MKFFIYKPSDKFNKNKFIWWLIESFCFLGGGCHETLGDFNPYSVNHGAPEYKSRHLGDLGNIEANATGIAVFRFKDKQVKLQDKVRGIIGRSVVVRITY